MKNKESSTPLFPYYKIYGFKPSEKSISKWWVSSDFEKAYNEYYNSKDIKKVEIYRNKKKKFLIDEMK